MNELSGMAPHRIRVAEFVNSLYLGGAEGQVVELLRCLRDRCDFRVAVLQLAGPLLDEVRGLGLVPQHFPPPPSLAHPLIAGVIARTARWLRRERVELVHAHDFFTTILAVPAAKLAGSKVVVGRLDLGHWHGPLRRAGLARVTSIADHVIANAEAIRQQLIAREGIAADRVSVIRNGIDLVRFDRRLHEEPTLPIPETGAAPVALLIANMNHPVKHQEDFLVALAHARAQGSSLQGFLVGDGPRRSGLEALAAKLRLGAAVHFLGHRADVPAIAARCTMGVLCSTAEGLSNAIIEGMAARLPMVVTDAGGNAELVADGERGIVIPPENPFALSAALTQIAEHPAVARRMGRAGRAFVEKELSLARLAEGHQQLYQRLTQSPVDVLWGQSAGRGEPPPAQRLAP